MLLTLVGWFLLMLIFCVILAVVTRTVFAISPPGLSRFTQERVYKSLQQVEETRELMEHSYVKLQRIEDHIGSNPKSKPEQKRN